MTIFVTAVYMLLTVTSLRADVTPVIRTLTMKTQDNERPKIDKSNLHFVNHIKDNLRKNNDDYVAINLRDAKLIYEHDTRRRFNNTENATNDVDLVAIPQRVADDNETVFRSFSFEPIQNDDNFLRKPPQLTARTSNVRDKLKVTAHAGPIDDEEDRKARVESWKRLLNKSKRLRIYTSTPKIEPTSSPASLTPKATTQSRSPGNAAQLRMNYQQRKATQAARNRPMHAVLKLRTIAKGRAPPNADQLDMAPARGAYIHDLRVKGIFCHRNVLWPEGPKYDSRGNTVMPPFDPKLYKHMGKSFVDTTTALFVLPRCCNCCKKSVLGCQ